MYSFFFHFFFALLAICYRLDWLLSDFQCLIRIQDCNGF